MWDGGVSPNVVWAVVRSTCKKRGMENIAPHDLRRTCAKLCHSAGGELEQIQFLLGHVSVQTTERYLGCKQNLGSPVNDRFAPVRFAPVRFAPVCTGDNGRSLPGMDNNDDVACERQPGCSLRAS